MLLIKVQDSVTKEVKVVPITDLLGTLDDTLALKATTPVITYGTAAPTSTPGKIGDMFVDTATPKVYIAKGATASTDWVDQMGA